MVFTKLSVWPDHREANPLNGTGPRRQMAPRRNGGRDPQPEALALACREPTRHSARRPGAAPAQRCRGQASNAQAAQAPRPPARDGSRQASQLRGGKHRPASGRRASAAQGAEQPSREFAPAQSHPREGHAQVQIGTSAAAIRLGPRSGFELVDGLPLPLRSPTETSGPSPSDGAMGKGIRRPLGGANRSITGSHCLGSPVIRTI